MFQPSRKTNLGWGERSERAKLVEREKENKKTSGVETGGKFSKLDFTVSGPFSFFG